MSPRSSLRLVFRLLAAAVAAPTAALADTHPVIGPWGSGAAFNGQFQDELGARLTARSTSRP